MSSSGLCNPFARSAGIFFSKQSKRHVCNSVNLEQINICKTHECNREERMPISINHDIANMANTANMENTVNMANLYFPELTPYFRN